MECCQPAATVRSAILITSFTERVFPSQVQPFGQFFDFINQTPLRGKLILTLGHSLRDLS